MAESIPSRFAKTRFAKTLKKYRRQCVAGLVVAAAVLFALAWWRLPEWLYSNYSGDGKLKAITDTRTALLAGLVGVGALLTFSLNRRVHHLAEQGHITDRYTKAVEQLGAKAREVRVGGVYALRRIMDDSETDHGAVVDVLAAYVRERAQASTAGRSSQERKERPDIDIQAALTVLANRPYRPEKEKDRLRLADTYLAGANLRDAQFNDANLRYARLDNARLERGHFEDASMRGANLREAHLQGAVLDRTKLIKADLHQARNLTVEQITSACVYPSTELDPELAVNTTVRNRMKDCQQREIEKLDKRGRQNEADSLRRELAEWLEDRG